jgi:putative CocE/NonD family hydrolase
MWVHANVGGKLMVHVCPVETASMLTSDGVRLDADIYKPDASGPWPVLLLRQGYGRRVAATLCYAHPRWYAAHGYIVVVQDVRGRGSSEGVFRAFEHEASDGAQTIDWCASLPGANGSVGTYGFSFQGINQLLAASQAGPALKALAPAMIGWDLHADLMTDGGALRLAGTLGWAAQVGADNARREQDFPAYEALRQAAHDVPTDEVVPTRPAVLERWSRYHHYARWVGSGPSSSHWAKISPAAQRQAILARRLPMLFVGGWYDFTLPGTLAAWRAIEALQPDRTSLIVGPWTHSPWARCVGDVDFGEVAISPVDRLQVAWFDRWLKSGPDIGASVRLFDLGSRSWVESEAWRQTPVRFYLGGDGLASIDPRSGWLTRDIGPDGSETLVHDPWRPTPTVGGRLSDPAGPIDRRHVDQRGDVLTFTTAPMGEPLQISGGIDACLCAEADMPSYDLVCTLSRVAADGTVHAFAEGARRVTDATGVVETSVHLHAACITIMPGEAVRLSVAAASFPAYSVNPGQGDPLSTPRAAHQVTTVSLHHGASRSSYISIGLAEPETYQ